MRRPRLERLHKAGMKQLAYQHYGQHCGYKPDVSGFDKRNTREGRYAIWGPLHLLSQVDSSGLAKKPRSNNGSCLHCHKAHVARTKIALELHSRPMPAATPLKKARPRHAK